MSQRKDKIGGTSASKSATGSTLASLKATGTGVKPIPEIVEDSSSGYDDDFDDGK